MATRFALELLVAAVTAQIAADWGNSTSVVVSFGATEPRKNLNIGSVGRVVFTETAADGDVGEIGGAEQWPEPADPLFCLEHAFEIYVFARDDSQLESAEAQYHAGMTVLNEVIRAVYHATHNAPPITSPVVLGKPRRIKPEAQIPYGREYVIPCTIQHPILDIFDDQLIYTNLAPGMANVTEKHEGTTETYTTGAP